MTNTTLNGNSGSAKPRLGFLLDKRMLLAISVSVSLASFSLKGEESALPEGYVRLPHVDCAGNTGSKANHWVDTGLTPTNGWKIEVAFAPTVIGVGSTSYNACLWCARAKSAESTTAANMNFFYNVTTSGSTTSTSRFDFYDKYYSLANCSVYEKYVFTQDGNGFYVNGDLCATGTASSFAAGDRLVLFASYSAKGGNPAGNGSNGYIYSAKVWDANGVPLLDLVPCRRESDGVLGFYDVVGGRGFVTSGGANAFTYDDTCSWKSTVSEGEFTDGTNWTQNAAPTDGAQIDFSSVNANVSISSDVTITPSQFLVSGDIPTKGTDYEVVLDATGGALRRAQTEAGKDSFCVPYWASSKWVADNAKYSAFGINGTAGEPYRWQLVGGVFRTRFHPTAVEMSLESGTLEALGGDICTFAAGSVNGDYTNRTTFTVGNGALLAMKGNSTLSNVRTTFAVAGGTVYGSLHANDGGRIVMNGGKFLALSSSDSGDPDYVVDYATLGSFVLGVNANAESYLELHGNARMRSANGFGGSYAGLILAHAVGTTATAAMDGSSAVEIVGQASGASFAGSGRLIVANGENAWARLTMTDLASATVNNRCLIANGAGSSGFLLLSDNAKVEVTNANGDGVCIGSASSTEAVLSVSDEAVVRAPKVVSVANETAGFVRSELILDGGTVETAQISGAGALTITVSGGVFRASGDSTVAAPFCSGVKAFSVADGASIVIDTQGYDVYVNQDFGEGVTVEKRGVGTLFVAGPSSHEKTIVYEGDLEKTDESYEFGEIIRSLDAASWAATGRAAWDDFSSWDPMGWVADQTEVTIGKDAEIVLSETAYAKSVLLNSSCGHLKLAGASRLKASVMVQGAGEAKEWDVADEDDVTIEAYAFSAETAEFAKVGAGRLTLDLGAITTQAFISSASNEVREGTLVVRGGESAPYQVNGQIYEGAASIKGHTYIGGSPADDATLVLDRVGFGKTRIGQTAGGDGGAIYIGYKSGEGAPAAPCLVMLNGAMFCSGSLYVGYECNTPCSPLLAVTNSKVVVRQGTKIYFGYATTSAAANNITASARFGAGALLEDAVGGASNGEVFFGSGCDVAFDDGAVLDMDNGATATQPCGWLSATKLAYGNVRFTNGGRLRFKGGLFVNNCDMACTDSRKMVLGFDNGVLEPLVPDAAGREGYKECRYLVVRAPEYQGLEAGVGGMRVDMSTCSRYTIAAPIRGVGELLKTGAGTLVLGKGRTFADGYAGVTSIDDGTVTNSANVVDSGVVTVQNAGGVHVAEGTVELESGATGTNSTFTIDADCKVDLAGNEVEIGTASGEGEVSGGTIKAARFSVLEDEDKAALLKDVIIRKAYVDFGGAAVRGRNYRIARFGSGVGGIASGRSFRARAVNTGDKSLTVAICSIGDDGTVTAKPDSSGLVLMVR